MSEAAAAPIGDVRQPASIEAEKKVLGVTNGKMAMWIFLGSDGMSFMGLIAAYVALRIGNESTWPIPGEYLGITLTATMTFILILSSVTMVKAFEGAAERNVAKLQKYLWLTILGGSAFLGLQVYEYQHFFLNTHSTNAAGDLFRIFTSGIWLQDGEGGWNLLKNSGLFGGTFFVLTAFHGCHVLSGVIYLLVVQIGVMRGRWTLNRIEIVGLYWHFVDLVWIVIFTIVYLVETRIPGASGG